MNVDQAAIGVFDSGLGGLIITHSLMRALPQYDYIYLGDTARVPYGNRSQQVVYEYSVQAVRYLFARGCKLVIIACNTASAEALRKIQRELLPAEYPDRKVLGVIIPTAEAAVSATTNKKIGVIATHSTVNSAAFVRELHKLDVEIDVYQQAAPLLVPLIENDGAKWADPILDAYLEPLLEKEIDSLILGCTHFPALKQQIRAKVGAGIVVISQDEVLPEKLASYLVYHPEIDDILSKNGKREFLVTDVTDGSEKFAATLFHDAVPLQLVHL